MNQLMEHKIFIHKWSANSHYAVSSKIIRTFEKICFQKSYLIQFYEMNICQIMIFKLHTVYNKCEMIKIGNQTRVKSQVLSQVLE